MKEPKRTRRLRLFAIVIGVAMVVTVSAAAVGKYWFFPRMLRARLEQAADDCWLGEFTVWEVDFRYFSPIRLRGVTLTDAGGGEWVRASEIRVDVTDRFTNPTVAGMEMDSLELIARCRNGRCCPPLREISDGFQRLLRQVRRFQTDDIRILRSDDGGPERLLVRLDFHAETNGEIREAFLNADSGGSQTLRATFQAEPTDEHRWLISRARAWVDGAELVENASMFVNITDDGIKAEDILADVCGGTLSGAVRGAVAEDRCMEYLGRLHLRDVSPARVARAMGWDEPPATAADADITFHGSAGGLNMLRGLGSLRIRNVAVDKAGQFAGVWKRLGLSGWSQCDVALEFTLTGPVVTIRGGEMAAASLSARVEPGGTIDLLSREVDVYVTSSAADYLPQLHPVPSAQLLAKLYGKLSRQRITGRWDRVDSLTITPAPMQANETGGMIPLRRRPAERTRDAGEQVGTWLSDRLGFPATSPADEPEDTQE